MTESYATGQRAIRVHEYGYWGGGNQRFIITGDSTSGYTIQHWTFSPA